MPTGGTVAGVAIVAADALINLCCGAAHHYNHCNFLRRELPEDKVARLRNLLRGLRDRWHAGAVTRTDVEARIGAWIAHADHADTFWLRQAMFKDGWFERAPGMR